MAAAKGQESYRQTQESVAEKIVRLGRKYGIGILVSTQQLEDLPKVFYNSSALVMLHQHREASYHGKDILQLDPYEQEYIKNAAQGEMLLLDRGRAQAGNPHSQYIKVTPLTGAETQALSRLSEPYSPAKITEPEMPIEVEDGGAAVREEPQTEGKGVLKGLGVEPPSVAIHRFMVALSRTGDTTEANRMMKDKKWLTGKASIYGGGGKQGILERAQSKGYVDPESKLTQRAAGVIDGDALIARQGANSGGEEHKELMRKTIRMIQDAGKLAFTLDAQDSSTSGR